MQNISKMYDLQDLHFLAQENQTLEEASSGSTYNHTTYIIFYLTLSILCSTPSIFLILFIVKHGLHRKNLYFAMLHWSLANIGSIIVLLSFIIEIKIDESPISPSDISYTWILLMDALFRMVPAIISVFFIFDGFIKSIKCRSIIYGVWGMFLSTLLIAASCFVSGNGHSFYVILAYIFLIIKIQSVFLLIVKTIAHFILYASEELYKLRTALATIYIVSSLSQWFWNRINNYPDVFSAPSIVLDILFYGNGFINVALLVSFDKDVKTLLGITRLQKISESV